MKDQGIAGAEVSKLYKQVESKLETIAERLLLSKMTDNESILQRVEEMIERIFIASAMKIAQDNICHASKLLGINRNTLSKKLKQIRQPPQ
jgi:DNA-binding NtrC family response regulator